MKKIFVLVMAFVMMVGLFAYEPKKDCAKVKRNGNVVYYEKTELYDYYGGKPDLKRRGWDGRKTSHDYVKWSIYKGTFIYEEYTVDKLVDYNYERFDSLRDSYLYYLNKSLKPDVSNAAIAITDCINKINGTNETPEEHASKTALELAGYAKRTAILSVPFVTEESFLTLTKEEMLAKMYTFIEGVKAAK